MQYKQAEQGRIFTLRLGDEDEIPGDIEKFARKENVRSALVFFLGGADSDSKVVTGPEENSQEEIVSQINYLSGISEALGIGTIFPDEDENPKLHLHAAFGRGKETITGCTRKGISVWLIGEVIVMELVGHEAVRVKDSESEIELLSLE